MIIWFIIVSGILGAIIGSFLNVCACRYGTGLSIASGRSQCPRCSKTLSAKELVPIFSFVLQRGRCTGCHSKISWQYPLVELCSAIIFGLVFLKQYSLYSLYSLYPHGLLCLVLLTFFYWVVVSILIVIAIYDARHKIILQKLVYAFIILSVAKLIIFFTVFSPGLLHGFSPSLYWDLSAPIILFLPFWFLWLISGGRWIGFGDAQLAFGIGALLGLTFGLSAIVLGFWIGAVYCITLLVFERLTGTGHLTGKSEIPLGPFLIIATLIVLFWHIDVLGLSQIVNL